MKKEIAMMWADMLESDILEQTDCVLENSRGENCCLGVLCRMYEKEANLKIKTTPSGFVLFNDNRVSLPIELAKYVEMKTQTGYIDSIKTNLADINDNDGKTFPEIAKIIRKHYKEL